MNEKSGLRRDADYQWTEWKESNKETTDKTNKTIKKQAIEQQIVR